MAGGGTKAILYAFYILSIITIVEVAFGIIRPLLWLITAC